MIKNENIICISSIDWDFVWQGHQEIMSTFARNGNRVLFIENTGVRVPRLKDLSRLRKRILNWAGGIKGFHEKMENLFVYSPIIIPFPYSRLAGFINRYLLIRSLKRWMKVMEFNNPIIWTFLPTGTALDIINSIDKKLLIYYCIADFYQLADSRSKVERTENELIKKSDLIFVQGNILRERCIELNTDVHIFPFGVNLETFDDLSDYNNKVPKDMQDIKEPIIGYIGGIHRHIDFDLLRFIAMEHPDWSVVLIGPIQTDISKIRGLKNIFLLGKKEFSCLPDYVSRFDVGIIPYIVSDYTATVFPTKLNEYHAIGKAVVSTNLPEIAGFNVENNNLVFISNDYKEFTDCILKAIHNKDKELISRRIFSAKNNSWERRIEEMSILIEEGINKKIKISPGWPTKLLEIYNTSRKKVLKLIFASSLIYYLVFYTPLVWFMAVPLMINQTPYKADAIVVFAGGVGESGRPGQGYEERVQYAVDLYKQGYANRIICSSGYKYVFHESQVMQALAVSLGVSEDAIILEDMARNSYENVVLSSKILHKNNCSKIILVSSPYHMRRVSLIFNKIARNIKVTYSPFPNSRFYSHPIKDIHGRATRKQITAVQIKAIFHEYLGILYYWSKGWI